MTQHKFDRVQAGDKVWIYYDEYQDIQAIVRRVYDRKEGNLSIRIDRRSAPNIPSTNVLASERWIPLVVSGDDWELERRIVE